MSNRNALCSCGSGRKFKRCCGADVKPQLSRQPPRHVRRMLRKEVGYGCPVEGCGNPYLEYHHFDPPWAERQHHEPEGMIALCSRHHPQADSGAWTREQLREMKRPPNTAIGERFHWMRRDILTVVGGNFFYNVPIALRYHGKPVIWYRRDEENRMLLNLRMLTSSRDPRLILNDNDWLLRGNPVDFKCPPSGKVIDVHYANGDALKIQFLELSSEEAFNHQYPSELKLVESLKTNGIALTPLARDYTYPITVCEITVVVGGTGYTFTPRGTTFPNGNRLSGVSVRDRKVGIDIVTPP